MENQLSRLEKQIDDLLASVDDKSASDEMQGKAPLMTPGTMAAAATRNEKAKDGA